MYDTFMFIFKIMHSCIKKNIVFLLLRTNFFLFSYFSKTEKLVTKFLQMTNYAFYYLFSLYLIQIFSEIKN